MATYPVLPTSYGSDPEPINSIEIDRAVDGTARARSFQSTDKVRIPVKHPRLTADQKATLEAFYAANRVIPFDYAAIDGVTRSCMFKRPPRWKRAAANRHDADVELEQV
jgi:hypothetical protein